MVKKWCTLENLEKFFKPRRNSGILEKKFQKIYGDPK